ncbi:hypothetical protein ABMA28_000693 [Loxostege sticticalis]|uniref:Odorant receptor n=1 Tax=Loxostege sticticalis TaxID=481309 RepID=A0ABD0T4S2_LOXSC
MTTVGTPNEMSRFFINLNKITYHLGLPNLWIDDVDAPLPLKKIHKGLRFAMNVIILLFMMSEWAAFLTQSNLTEKQATDRLMFGFSHPTLFSYVLAVEYHQERITNMLHKLAMVLKEEYNDKDIERKMVKKAMSNAAGFACLFMMALIFYGYDGIMQVIRGDGTFTTVITFWPDVTEISYAASITRVATYFIWCVFMTRVCAVYCLVIPTTVCLSHQFKNLQSYFYSLVDIFDEDLEQTELEKKYEEAFKVGIKMHSKTLECTKDYQTAYNVIVSNQVLTTVGVLVLLMSQMVDSERTLENVLSIVTTGSAMLISTGFFMWNAGDVTVEAAELATAVYCSGWAHCQHSAPRVRRLLVITMMQAQKPVVIWALGIVELSYQSYVSIVKSSYSVFSVLY